MTDSARTRIGRVAIALSGGGHRASLFGLGVLLYLADAGKNRDVVSVSSVSGGSLTNAFVAQSGDYSRLAGKEFERRIAQPFARQVAQIGTLWASWTTWAYVATLCLAFLAVLSIWWLLLDHPIRIVGFVLGLTLLSFLASYRSAICALALRRTLYTRSGRASQLCDINSENVQHIICATELRGGEHVYFSGDFVCSYRLGWGCPAGLSLADAVQASAAFPGALPPRWLTTAQHGFVDGARDTPRFMVLSDGGVYDNMAEQWPIGVQSRKRRWPMRSESLHESDTLVVVNASGPLQWDAVRRLRFPVIGEILALLRVLQVLYDKTTTTRRIGLVDRFDRAAREQHGLEGALIMINRSPYWTADYFNGQGDLWPDRGARARRVIEVLGNDCRDQWEELTRSNRRVKTTLARLGGDVAANLIYHGYVLAMANLHVILGLPLIELPSIDRFRKMTE